MLHHARRDFAQVLLPLWLFQCHRERVPRGAVQRRWRLIVYRVCCWHLQHRFCRGLLNLPCRHFWHWELHNECVQRAVCCRQIRPSWRHHEHLHRCVAGLFGMLVACACDCELLLLLFLCWWD